MLFLSVPLRVDLSSEACCAVTFILDLIFTDTFAGDALSNLNTFFSDRDYIMSEAQTSD